jgi:hypothetical protein
MSEKVTVNLHVKMMQNGDFYFEKPAPKLPSCLTWHEGVMIEILKDEEWLIVDHVALNLDGSVSVFAEIEMPGAGWGPMTKSEWWEKRGWIPCVEFNSP